MPGAEPEAARLRALSQLALNEPEPDALLAAAAEALAGVDQVHLVEVSQDAAVGHARVAGGGTYVQVLDERPSGVGHVVATGEPLHVADARESGRLRSDYSSRFEVGSALFVPLAWRGEVRHVLIAIRHAVRPFSDADAELVHLVADLVAAALALRESTEHQAARSDHDGALATAARALATESDLHAVLEAVARAAVEALGGGMSGVYLRQDDGSGVATAGYHSPPEWEGYVMRPGEGVAGQVLATGRVAIANAYQSEVQLPENTGLRRLQTAVSVPMVLDGRLVGALSIGFIRMRRVGDGDLRTLQALADLAAVACRTAERR